MSSTMSEAGKLVQLLDDLGDDMKDKRDYIVAILCEKLSVEAIKSVKHLLQNVKTELSTKRPAKKKEKKEKKV